MRPFLQLVTIFYSVLLCATIAFGQENPNPSSSVDALIMSEMELEQFPGVSAVIVKDGQIVWIESYGLADVEQNIPVQDTTVFLLASISKLFTGTAAMQLHEENAIDIDDNVNDYLPWSLQIPAFPAEPVTLRQLMTHTSSIRDDFDTMENYYDFPDPTITLADCMQPLTWRKRPLVPVFGTHS